MNPLKVKDDYQKDKIGVFAIQYHVLACNIHRSIQIFLGLDVQQD